MDNNTSVARVVSGSMLASISDFASALAVLDDAGIGYESISDYGDGFAVVSKDKLVDRKFIIVEWRFNDSDKVMGKQFVSAACVTETGEKVIINDGGTGVCSQLAEVSRIREESNSPSPFAGLLVPGGLVKSDYTYTDAKGNETEATTYYLSESPA